MFTSAKIRSAQRMYDAGLALFHEHRYFQALAELKNAEDAFRRIDARGHPFTIPLANGVSGLANTLALCAQCYQSLGDNRNALRYYETSLINEKFEKKRPFRAFRASLDRNLITCYENELQRLGQERIALVLQSDPVIDTAFTFPFSLEPDATLLVRLYQLAPDRYPHHAGFHDRARAKDASVRRQNRRSDEPAMKRASAVIWITLLFIWSLYGVLAVHAMLNTR